jgi:Dehydrogenases with different specificities (related to short-chain alcohol dehydrogenases)
MVDEGKDTGAGLLSLAGRVAVISGAGQGVGRRIAELMLEHGAKVAVNDFFAERAEQAVAELAEIYGADMVAPFAADVSDNAAVQAMAGDIAVRLGTPDILVNNAGNAGPGQIRLPERPFWEEDPASWGRWMQVNLFGVMNCCHAFAPGMVAARRGSIVTIISDAGRVGESRLEPYSAAKAGAAGFMRALARSLGRYTVRANCVSMGTMRTSIAPDGVTAAHDGQLAKYVLRRFGETDDVANTVLFLASEASGWTTGQTYPVNGGYSLAL